LQRGGGGGGGAEGEGEGEGWRRRALSEFSDTIEDAGGR